MTRGDSGSGGEGGRAGEGVLRQTAVPGVRFALPKREGEGGLSPSSAALTVPGHVPSHKLKTEGGEEKHTHTHQQECVRLLQELSLSMDSQHGGGGEGGGGIWPVPMKQRFMLCCVQCSR